MLFLANQIFLKQFASVSYYLSRRNENSSLVLRLLPNNWDIVFHLGVCRAVGNSCVMFEIKTASSKLFTIKIVTVVFGERSLSGLGACMTGPRKSRNESVLSSFHQVCGHLSVPWGRWRPLPTPRGVFVLRSAQAAVGGEPA